MTTTLLAGHAPGHLGVRIGGEAVIITDAAPHPLMLDRPEATFFAETDREQAVATRRALLAELVDASALTICGHYPDGGIGRTVTQEGHVVWEPA